MYSSRLSGSASAFRIAIQYLVDIEDYKAINTIVEFLGYLDRWDELVAIMAKNTKTFDIGIKVLKEQFAQDLRAMKSGKPVSRMARWIPGISINNNPMANQIAEALGYTPSDYYEIVVKLRSCIERPNKTEECSRYYIWWCKQVADCKSVEKKFFHHLEKYKKENE